MAVKRRIIWMSDEEWAVLQQIAEDRGETISSVIRNFWTVAAATTGPVVAHADSTGVYGMTQGERDAILRRMNKGA